MFSINSSIKKCLNLIVSQKLKDYSRPLNPTLLCSLFTFTILKKATFWLFVLSFVVPF
uniref:Uncharacterized protein n=1 Tax=Anguilla anguilla TaxID=7936 RepID=A0A0E9QJF7_ANGAN